jgi:RNA polymerase sigma-70 factor (ECF subfamily)
MPVGNIMHLFRRHPVIPAQSQLRRDADMAPETDSSDRPDEAGATGPGAGGFAGFGAEALPHMDTLFRAAASMLHSRSEAEDAVQEVYLQALKSFHRFTPGTNCRAWLFRILFHVISHHRRKWFGRIVFSEREELEQTAVYMEPVAEQLTDDEVIQAFRKLPQQFAEVVMLADVQEFSYKEIQETLGIPVGTVMSRLSRGRQLLRVHLADCDARAGNRPQCRQPGRRPPHVDHL